MREKERAPSPKWGEGKGFEKYSQLKKNDEASQASSTTEPTRRRFEKVKKDGAGGGSETKSKRAMASSRGKMAGAPVLGNKNTAEMQMPFFSGLFAVYLKFVVAAFRKGLVAEEVF